VVRIYAPCKAEELARVVKPGGWVITVTPGPRRLLSDRGVDQRRGTATGSALLALAADELPGPEDLGSLRRPMRAVLMHHLGGRGLKSWEMLEDLARRGT